MNFEDLPSFFQTEQSITDGSEYQSISTTIPNTIEPKIKFVAPTPQLLAQNSIVVDKKTFIELGYLVQNKNFVVQQAKQKANLIYNKQKIHQSLPQSYRSSRPERQKFRWEIQQQTVFAIVVSGLGISSARPKQILPLMPVEYNLDQQMIASHLQKYRQKIIKDFNLSSMNDIQNQFYPQHITSPIVKEISDKWKGDAAFHGYTEGQIKEIIRSL
ncbi:hypothetical protein SS50377_25564 [Spironucleus salmonicida]|uniref:Uncharacterized protein n=1 Tax=Spironucleus salmonicida TaxID=348837 RepID=V6LKL0_9EUKA|nr:hypothetical protein SS50377_25564 [Spironucleus salmonicida]|eukprot:EST45112.1 Hypothetical protein SS50377_15132 [Spironucleus salmonicida]